MRKQVVLLFVAIALDAHATESGLQIGTSAPENRVQQLLQGPPASQLAGSLKGKVVVLEFWATWCPLCRALEPSLAAAHARYGRAALFLAIGVGVNQSPASIKRHLTQHPLPFPVLFDATGAAVRAYEAPTTSYIVVVDKAGMVTYTGTGDGQDIAAVLQRIASD